MPNIKMVHIRGSLKEASPPRYRGRTRSRDERLR
jgi:hypothetical protein